MFLRISSLRCFTRTLSMSALSLTLILFAFASIASAQDKSHSWTDKSGKYKTQAEFVKLDGNNLIIRKSDGSEKTIPLDKLDSESQALAKSLSQQASKGPSTVRSSKPTKIGDNMEPDAFVDLIVDELNKKNSVVLWDAIPASKQKEFESVVTKAAKKIDSRTFDKLRIVRKSIFEIARKQKDFILNSKVINIPPEEKSQIETAYPAIVNALESYLSADLLDGKRLQKGDLRSFFSTYIGNLQKSLDELANVLPENNPIRQQLIISDVRSQVDIKVERISRTEAELNITPKNPPPNAPEMKPQPMVLVLDDGRWLPRDMVRGWDATMGQAEMAIAAMKPDDIHSSVMLALGFINLPLNNLKNAKTQEEFDAVLEDLKGSAMSMIPGGGGGMPPPGFGPGPGGNPPPPGFGGNGGFNNRAGGGRPGAGGNPPTGQGGGNQAGPGGQPSSE